MPLVYGRGRAKMEANMHQLRKVERRPLKQAIAIALSMQRRKKKRK